MKTSKQTTADNKEIMRKKREKQRQFRKEQERLSKEAMELILKRSGISKKTIINTALKMFCANNLDLLTASERKKYKSIFL